VTATRWTALGLAVALVAAACSSGGDDEETARSTVPPTTSTTAPSGASTTGPPAVPFASIALKVTELARLDGPVAVTFQPGSPSLYVAELAGRVRKITVDDDRDGDGRAEGGEDTSYRLERAPVLDISDRVISGGERGLLGIAFSPDGRRLYLDYTLRPSGDTRLDEYTMESSDPDSVDEGSRRELIALEDPFPNHNGGNVLFGPDGYLYVGYGDGGSQGDPDGNGQNTGVLLGKLLRVDPEGREGGRPYAIPADNPFADGEGGAPEVYLWGVRNPWRFSFDAETGDLWLADVGGSQREEIDLLPAADGAGLGANLGWDRMEGTLDHQGDGNPDGAVLPVHEHDHATGDCSITGGFVYRGTAIPELRGAYVYADYCSRGIRAIRVENERVIDERTWDVGIGGIQSFGEDPNRELLVMSADGGVYKLDRA
jgi:glucose/arabinose dehydrogenase